MIGAGKGKILLDGFFQSIKGVEAFFFAQKGKKLYGEVFFVKIAACIQKVGFASDNFAIKGRIVADVCDRRVGFAVDASARYVHTVTDLGGVWGNVKIQRGHLQASADRISLLDSARDAVGSSEKRGNRIDITFLQERTDAA